MNQLCKVCGEPAAGYHFGAFTCEGCKSFFGRTYNNISSIGECKNNGKCVINKKNRTACKSCRLRKCLMVGMSKSGSRYGRRSNWFKIHCLLQQQQQPQVQHHSFIQPLQTHTQHHNVNVNLAAAVGLLQPNAAFLSPFRSPTAVAAAASAISVASSAARDTASNSESDSGASSADPEDDVRPTSALSYLKPSASPLSDRMSSDTDLFSKNRLFNNNNNNNSNNNNNNNSKLFSDQHHYHHHHPHQHQQQHHHRVPLPRSPASFSSPPPPSPLSQPNHLAPPTRLQSSNALVVPNHRWLPPAFPILGDPATWHEFWLRGGPQQQQQPTVAAPAPDQDQPIDLSVKSVRTKKRIRSGSGGGAIDNDDDNYDDEDDDEDDEEDDSTETNDKKAKQTSKDLKDVDGECKVGVPLDLTLSER